ncbi:MAG: hypothetical protein ACM3ZT_00810 [Bacillota bacterium]
MYRIRVAIMVVLTCLPLAVPAMPTALQAKVESLARESDSLAKQRYRWEGVQQALLKQKKQIEDTQTAVMQQQSDLNRRNEAHNQQAAAQKQRIQGNRSQCGGAQSSSGKVNECDNDIKGINQASGNLNTDAAQLQSEQDSLNARYAQANQDASDWNAHEADAMDHLNKVYHAMNGWLDRAYDVITDPDFRDAVTAANADAYCENRGLPSGTLTIDTVKRLSDGYRKCLKYVLEAERKAQLAPAPATSQRPG